MKSGVCNVAAPEPYIDEKTETNWIDTFLMRGRAIAAPIKADELTMSVAYEQD
ncbi:MAG: hypothetical protein AAF892_02390 [Cyanobacteria bacterium P01_D01_bin.71]